MEKPEKIVPKLPTQEIDYYKIVRILLSRWYWIAACVIISMLTAYIYLWYTPKTYATSGTIKLEEKKSEISDLVSVISNSDRGPSKIQSETFVIQSRNVLLSAIRDIDYQISFYLEGRVRTNELYPQKPLNIQILKFDSTSYYHGLISYSPVNRQTYALTYNMGGKKQKQEYRYNTPVTVGQTSFSIAYPGDIKIAVAYQFRFNTPDDLLGRVKGGLRINEMIKNSNIVSLQQADSNPDFAADILNAIMNEYVGYDKAQKTLSASQMILFIDAQLKVLSNGVKGSEKDIENYKQSKKIFDVTTSAEKVLSQSSDLESQRSLLNIQLIAIDQLKKQLTTDKSNISLNFKMEGTVDNLLGGLIVNFNSLIAEKHTLLNTYNENSQPIQDINRQLLSVRKAALDNLVASTNRINKNKSYIDAQLAQLNQQINTLPADERNLVSLKRDFEINEKVYSYLSEKKLEAQISRSAILPGVTILETAQTNYGPVSPNDRDIRRSAMIFGFLAGGCLIIAVRVMNPYIYDKETIESLTSIPILGIIRKYPDEIDEYSTQILALSKPRSVFAESVRAVRTNLNFLAADKKSKVICITSEVAGEGKSFVAVNLSSTLSLIDKKVILVGADLRRSKLHKTFHVPNDKGLSNYLANQTGIDDIILNSGHEHFDFIVSGPVPPNPSELLHSTRMGTLIEELRARYDIVMIDTAPIGLVSDAIPLIRASDINVFVIRSGRSKFYAATIPQRIAQEYELDNTVIVLNAFAEEVLHSRYYSTKFTGGTYTKYYYYSDYTGYESSGYYVDDKNRKWWDIRKWFKKRQK